MGKIPAIRILLLAALALDPRSPVAAGVPPEACRYELGRRVRRTEVAFEKRIGDPAARRAVAPHLQAAVSGFFSLRLGDAARSIDEARRALEGGPPAAAVAASLAAVPARRLVGLGTKELRVDIARLYECGEVPPGLVLRLRVERTEGPPRSGDPVAVPLGSLPAEARVPLAGLEIEGRPRVPLAGLADGDHVLVAEVLEGGKAIDSWKQTISIVEALDLRLARIEATLGSLPPDASRSSRGETVRAIAGLLRSLASSVSAETDYPAARLLAEAEAAAAGLAKGDPYYGPRRPGQFWLRLRAGGSTVPVRVAVPESAPDAPPPPLVVALHGMGGSENLFFDGYGNGAIVGLCRERGWLLASPRSGLLGGLPLPEILDELARIYPYDRRRVLIVGHSMGAGQAVAAAARTPARFAAVAALGGGLRPGSAKAFEGLPTFIGVGSLDFALRGARGLERALREGGARRLVFREYADVEHLAVVQVALPDVFAFFDEAAGSKRTPGAPSAGADPRRP